MKFKITLFFLIVVVMISLLSACGKADKESTKNIKADEIVSPKAIETSEITIPAVTPTDPGINSVQDSSPNITVLSKSDSTIVQAEKDKVLDELSSEIDSLINEVNKDNSSDEDLE